MTPPEGRLNSEQDHKRQRIFGAIQFLEHGLYWRWQEIAVGFFGQEMLDQYMLERGLQLGDPDCASED